MKGKIFCDEKKLFLTFQQKEKDDVVSRLKYAYQNLIGEPNNGAILNLTQRLQGIII